MEVANYKILFLRETMYVVVYNETYRINCFQITPVHYEILVKSTFA